MITTIFWLCISNTVLILGLYVWVLLNTMEDHTLEITGKKQEDVCSCEHLYKRYRKESEDGLISVLCSNCDRPVTGEF